MVVAVVAVVAHFEMVVQGDYSYAHNTLTSQSFQVCMQKEAQQWQPLFF